MLIIFCNQSLINRLVQINALMGRVKPTFIKRAANEVFKNYKDRISEDFEKNKGVVQELIRTGIFASPSKRMRNKVGGVLVRSARKAPMGQISAPKKIEKRRTFGGRGRRFSR